MLKAALRFSTLALLALAFLAGPARAQVDVLDHTTPCTQVANTTAETTIYSLTVPAGTISNTYRGVLHEILLLSLTNNTGSNQNVTWRIKVAGTTRWQDTVAYGSDSEGRPIIADLRFAKYSSGNTGVSIYGSITKADVGSTPVSGVGRLSGATGLLQGLFASSDSAADWSAAQTIAVTAQFATASGSLTLDCAHGYMLVE